MDNANTRLDLSRLTPAQQHERKREWNRGPLGDLFPRIPVSDLERVLDRCIEKDFVYNLSESKFWNARRYNIIVIAHVRHLHSDYDRLLRDGSCERYAARQATAQQIWKVLRDWCPWDDSNEVLERCFRATLLPIEQRDPTWDPMDIDSDDESGAREEIITADVGDPMDLD